jgi:pimeloyl-ACP methyl ester carboxylesterase
VDRVLPPERLPGERRELAGRLRHDGDAAPARPLFQAATATFNPSSATKVNVGNKGRGPLLLVSGEKDHTVPPIIVKSTLKAYRESTAITELKEFAGRGHSLTIDSGWREIAEYSLAWLREKGL